MYLSTLARFVAYTAIICTSITHAAEVTNTTRYHDDTLGITILSGEVRLPADGNWTLVQPPADSGLRQVFYEITHWDALHGDGARTLANRLEDQLRDDRWLLATHHTLLLNYAKQHGDRGPARLDDPELLALVAHYGRLRKADEKPEPEETQSRLIAEFREKIADIGLVPNVLFGPHQNPFDASSKPPLTPPSPLLLELTPALDDGKHWVLYTDYSTERVTIDTELLKKLGLTISKRDVIHDTVAQRPAEQIIKLHARLTVHVREPVTLVFHDTPSERVVSAYWDWTRSTPGTRAQLTAWADLRAAEWAPLQQHSEAPILRTWLNRAPTLYGLERTSRESSSWFDSETSLSFFALFGGRAAVQETLQLHPLEARDTATEEESSPPPPVALADIPGVEVRAHPFADMVRGKTTPSLPLSEFIPHDRAFFYAAKPAALNQFFAPDSAFVRNVVSFAGPGTHYGLRDRYSDELGLTPELLDALLDSGLIAESAIFTPDVFFADGTDITVITRVRSGALLGRLLKPVLSTLSAHDGIYTVPTSTGASYWAIQEDTWILSTQLDELKSALALAARKGEGSLGRSDEFRYMLHKLPPTADTRAYVYFSDAFIRRLVGPAVKIAQTRRIKARLAMERLVAAALLRRLDAPEESPSIAELARMGYLNSTDLPADTILHADLTVSSPSFGPLARMKPLSAQAASITQVSADEAAAYKRYLESYTRFWSRYFDPIAIRLDTTADDQHSLTTFILPLVENTAYNELREWMDPATANKGVIPVFNRTPTARLDLVLSEEMWRSFARGVGSMVEDYVSVGSQIYDLLGPGMHVAFENAESVVRLDGAGAAFQFYAGRRSRSIEATIIIPLIHFLTRPTHLVIELSDPEEAARLLDEVRTKEKALFSRYFLFEFNRRGDAPEWLLTFRPLDVASVHFSLRIDGRYLIVSNAPQREPLRVTGTRPARLAGASLTFNPKMNASDHQADFASAMRTQRTRALVGMGHLYPWMLALGDNADAATERNAYTLGFTPKVPAGELVWNGDALEHSVFGSVSKGRLPNYDPSARFGLFEHLSDADVSMQFEDDGLRTELRWRMLPDSRAPAADTSPRR